MTARPAFRRAIAIHGRDGVVEAEMEDDFHRFGVTVRHDGLRALRIEARAHRYPWVTCQEAPAALTALEGVALSANPAALFSHADPRHHCTHLFELAALALAHAARGDGRRLYEAEVTDPEQGARAARLTQDGQLVMEWRLHDDRITAPPEYAGRAAGSFRSGGLAALDPDLAERLLILRRVVQTAGGRAMNVDAYATAAAMGRPPACYSLQPAIAGRARRIPLTHRDWSDFPSLLRSLGPWSHLDTGQGPGGQAD